LGAVSKEFFIQRKKLMGRNDVKMTIRILYALAGALILALMTFVQADKYFRSGFYGKYLGIMLAVLLALWAASCLLIRKSVSSLSLGAGLLRWLGMLSLVIIIGTVVEHFVLAALQSGSAGRSQFSPFSLIFNWIGGGVLFLGWHVLFLLGRALFSRTSPPVLRVVGIVLASLIVVAVVFIAVVNIAIRRSTRADIYSLSDIPSGKVAVVFGAGVWEESMRPTAVLQDRIKAAVELVRAGKVEQVILSGDGEDGGLEVDVMEQYALESGIPAEALLLDPLGVRTYATCRQARDAFGVEEAILVTQNFHLPRALFLCRSLGVESVGVSADLRTYTPFSHAIWALRESIATAYAWLEVMVGN
jgi:SanA protein